MLEITSYSCNRAFAYMRLYCWDIESFQRYLKSQILLYYAVYLVSPEMKYVVCQRTAVFDQGT